MLKTDPQIGHEVEPPALFLDQAVGGWGPAGDGIRRTSADVRLVRRSGEISTWKNRPYSSSRSSWSSSHSLPLPSSPDSIRVNLLPLAPIGSNEPTAPKGIIRSASRTDTLKYGKTNPLEFRRVPSHYELASKNFKSMPNDDRGPKLPDKPLSCPECESKIEWDGSQHLCPKCSWMERQPKPPSEPKNSPPDSKED